VLPSFLRQSYSPDIEAGTFAFEGLMSWDAAGAPRASSKTCCSQLQQRTCVKCPNSIKLKTLHVLRCSPYVAKLGELMQRQR